MKTHTIKTPTADLLIVELAEGLSQMRKNTLSVMQNEGWKLLGKPDEIREDDVDMMVEAADIIGYKNYKGEIGLNTALESLLSLLESEIFWDVNPYEKPETCFMERFQTPSKSYEEFYLEWHEAEQKTFNRNRTLIFVKN